jgi:hypothetical protein
LLVHPADIGYTACMRRIDNKWTGVADGYLELQLFKTKLEAEFGRAVRVGQKQHFRKELTEWQKKRRVFFALVAIAPLSIITLCLTSIYFREVACVIIYWVMVVLVILVTLAVAGRQYILEMVNGKPVPQAEGLVVDLEGRWWQRLAPREPVVEKSIKKEPDFASLLDRFLADTYCARNPANDTVLMAGACGVWLFHVVDWSGTVIKQEGAWKLVQTWRDKFLRKKSLEITFEPGPDDQLLEKKQAIEAKLKQRLPEQAWILEQVRGGIVFVHPKVKLDKERIQGNRASFGVPKAWAGRILNTPAVEGFTTELQLGILDALAAGEGQQTHSTKDEAERLYQQAALELRAYVAKMVK